MTTSLPAHERQALSEKLALQAELQRRGLIKGKAVQTEAERDWRTWLQTMMPRFLMRPGSSDLVPFGDHHTDVWEWVWALERGRAPAAQMVAIWPRGGGKSTTAEMAGAAVGALRKRKYVLYVCEQQQRAEDHVGAVAAMFESPQMAAHYPHVANRGVSKYGSVKGWRRNRLHTHSGFVVDAIGFDSAARGAKIEEVRPDFMIFDDIDGDTTNPEVILSKINLLTKKFLPAGSPDLAVLMVQNLIHPTSIFSRLAGVAEFSADFLHNRIVSGPFPALYDMTYEEKPAGQGYRITGGRPIWQGMDLSACQHEVDTFGLSAFLTECQQEVDTPPGGMFDHIVWRRCHAADVPPLRKTVAWVDPAVTATDRSDSHGLQIDGIADDGQIYRLYSHEERLSPEAILKLAICKAIEFKCSSVGVETDQGGDTWEAVYRAVAKQLIAEGELPPRTPIPPFRAARAGGGAGPKAHRASQMLADYERGRFVHVFGTHAILERSLRRFPRTKPFDLVDAAFWSWHDLSTTSAPFSITVLSSSPTTTRSTDPPPRPPSPEEESTTLYNALWTAQRLGTRLPLL